MYQSSMTYTSLMHQLLNMKLLFSVLILGLLSSKAFGLTQAEYDTIYGDLATYFENDSTFLPTAVRLGNS